MTWVWWLLTGELAAIITIIVSAPSTPTKEAAR